MAVDGGDERRSDNGRDAVGESSLPSPPNSAVVGQGDDVIVDSSDTWMSYAEAGVELGISSWRVRIRAGRGDLDIEQAPDGQWWVSRDSVVAEQLWQRNASPGARAIRWCRYAFNWVEPTDPPV